MALFDGMREKKEQRKREVEALLTADEVAKEEYKQKLIQSELVQSILSSINEAKDLEENSWICLAEDYYDHDPREVSVEPDGDGIKIQRIHYYDSIETVQVPTGNGYIDREIKLAKCDVVSTLAYGFVKSGFKPIDAPRTVTASTGHDIKYSADDIRKMVEDIVYERLQQLLPKCEFKGRVTNYLGSRDSVGPKMKTYEDLTYFVPAREYKEWY